MAPTALSITGVIDDQLSGDDEKSKRQSIICDMQELNLNMCPQMLNTSLKMLSSIQASFQKVIFLLVNPYL